MTGKEPAILGLELGYPGQFRGYDDLIVQHAVEHAHRGGLVTLTWHAPNPLKECELGKEYKCSLDRMSDEEFALMLKPGTRANAQWIEDIAGLASILKRLEAEGVVVLFRPLHEMNGRWFWWGKREKFPELWESLFDKLIDDYGLTNLITVWAANGDASDAAQYFPTAHLPDVVGTDVYRTNNGGPDFLDGFRNVSKLAPDSLFTYAEVGHVPDPVTMATARPAWVLVWGREFLNGEWGPPSTSNKRYNTREETVAFFKSEHTMGLEELPMSSREMIAGRKVSMRQRPLCPDSWP